MTQENKYIQAVKTYIKNLEQENATLKIELKMVILVNKELRNVSRNLRESKNAEFTH